MFLHALQRILLILVASFFVSAAAIANDFAKTSADSSKSLQLDTRFKNFASFTDTISRDSIEVYPNPTLGQFYLRMSPSALGNVIVEIYNSKGMVELTKTFLREDGYDYPSFDISYLKPGAYFIIVSVTNISPVSAIVIKQ